MSQTISGVLKKDRGGFVLRNHKNSFKPGADTIMVPSHLARKYALCAGAMVEGTLQEAKKGYKLDQITKVGGLAPEQFSKRAKFKDLIVISPQDRLRLGDSGNLSMRIVDLIAPVGKGTRGLIVSPPKAGKTTMLEHLANSISDTEPDARVMALLVDERPEEVTHFRRSVKAEVYASTNDQSVQDHVDLTEMLMSHVRVELECGRDVVVLVDSLTRMGRAYNLASPGSGRTMSGGLEAGAMETPRRFFGMARNIEGGGSVTILATALVDTGSRMDELIFQEFKGTGNSEIVLDRWLADSRIFPAIHVGQSGTRREDLLYDQATINRINRMRRMLSSRQPKDAIELMIRMMDKYETNDAFLKELPE
jgi:transcription termination factor Rho